MVYGCGAKTVKCLVFFFNFLAFLSGLIIFLACIISYFSPQVRKLFLNKINEIPNVDTSGISTLNVVLIIGMVVGGVIFLLGFAGCCGALAESSCLLGFFAVAMVLLLIIQVVLGIVAFAFQDKAEDWIQKAVNATAVDANKGNPNGTACQIFATLASQDICCEKVVYHHCNFNCTTEIEDKPCSTALWGDLKDNLKTAGIVLLVLLVLELMATVFACCLCSAIRRGDHLYETV